MKNAFLYFLLLFSGWILASPSYADERPYLVAQSDPVGPRMWKKGVVTPDGKYFLCCSDFTPMLWELETGKLIRTFYGHDFYSRDIALAPNGKYFVIISAEASEMAISWDIRTGELLWRTQLNLTPEHMSFSPDGKTLAVSGSRLVRKKDGSISEIGKLRFLDVHTGSLQGSMDNCHLVKISSVQFSPNGKFLLTAGLDDATSSSTKIWNIPSMSLYREFKSTSNEIKTSPSETALFSPSGLEVLSTDTKGVKTLRNIETSAEILRFDARFFDYNDSRFSPDGRYLAFRSRSPRQFEQFEIFDLKTSTEIMVPNAISMDSFTADSKNIIYNGTKIFNIEKKASKDIFPLFSFHLRDLSLDISSPYHTLHFFCENSQSFESFNLETMSFSSDLKPSWETSAEFSKRTDFGYFVAKSNSRYDSDMFFFPIDGSPAVELKGYREFAQKYYIQHSNNTRTFSPLPQPLIIQLSSDTVAVGGGLKGKIALWNTISGEKIKELGGEITPLQLVCSSDGTMLAAVGEEKLQNAESKKKALALIWDMNTGQLISTLKWYDKNFPESIVSFGRGCFSPDNRLFITSTARVSSSGTLAWDIKKQTAVNYIFSTATGQVFMSADSQTILIPQKEKLRIWNFETSATPIEILHPSPITNTSFMDNDRIIMTYSSDETFRFFEAKTQKILASLRFFEDKTWAVTDEEGRYDASNAGDVNGLHWVKDMTAIDLSQLKDGFYEPRLLQKKLGWEKEPMRSIPKIDKLKLFPNIELKVPENATATQLNLTTQGGGFGRVSVWLNGKEWKQDARPKNFDARAEKLEIPLELKSPLIRPGEKNTVKVVAYNAEGTLASRPVEIEWQAPGVPEPVEPRLYAVVCGISQYANDKKIKTLRFAAKDARDIALALAVGAKSLFGADKTEIHLLTSDVDASKKQTSKNAATALLATKTNLRAAFAQIAQKARPQDVLVVYLAGHGTTLGLGKSTYIYPTQDADETDFARPEAAAKMVTDDELTEWTKAIPAQKQVLILDTCASGAAGTKLTEKRAVSGDQVRAIERLKDRTGYHVLMGCAADSVSYEANKFNQGLLTYALLEGMRGPAREAGNGLLVVNKWFQYAQSQVPKLAGTVGGIQEPQIKTPSQNGKAQDFPVLLLDDKAATSVPLSPAGILVLRPRVNDAEGEDPLGLEKLLSAALDNASFGGLSIGGQKVSGLCYVPVDELDGAWRVNGIYQTQGDKVSLDLTIRIDGKAPLKKTLTGSIKEVAELCNRAVASVRNATLGLTAPPILVTNGPSPKTQTKAGKTRRWPAKSGRDLQATTQDSDYFTGVPLPKTGEIALAGEVVSAQDGRMALKVLAFRLPSGKIQVLSAAKTKLVTYEPKSEVAAGDQIIVVGRDTGAGQPVAARAIF